MSDFEEELASARELLADEDATAFHVGVVRGGDEIDTAYARREGDPEEEGLQTLSLLATHLRIVAAEAGVDYETVAGDAASLARQVEEATFAPGDAGGDADGDADAGPDSEVDLGSDSDLDPASGDGSGADGSN